MVYKKFIKRNGKIYGPYNYHSRRVNGKVVSEYHGPKKRFNSKFFLILFGSLFLLSILVFIGFKLSGNLTGNVALNVETTYYENQPIDGTLKLSLNQGELLPIDSLLILSSPTKDYQFNLSDLVDEETLSGDYYVSGMDLSGNGSGYGLIGEKRIYPEIDFTLEISPSNELEGSDDNLDVSENEDNLDLVNNSSDDLNQSEIIENPENQDNSSQEEIISNDSEIVEEASLDNSDEINTESVTSDLSVSDESVSDNEIQEDSSSETESSDDPSDSAPDESNADNSSAPITGNVISNDSNPGFLTKIFGYLFGRITGNVISEVEEVSGSVSDSEFTYSLSSGQTASLKSGSVYYNGENIDDDYIDLSVNNDLVVVTSDYYLTEEGFGSEYLGEETFDLILDLSILNISSENGTWEFKIIYQNSEVISTNINFDVEGINLVSNSSNLNISNLTIINQTSNLTFTKLELSESDLIILREKFGNQSVEIKKAEEVNNRIEVRMEIGDYWIETTYDDVPDLENYINNDRVKWLKDLAKTLSEEDPNSKIREDLIQNYSI